MRIYGSTLGDIHTCKYGCCGGDLVLKHVRPRASKKASRAARKQERQNARKVIARDLREV